MNVRLSDLEGKRQEEDTKGAAMGIRGCIQGGV